MGSCWPNGRLFELQRLCHPPLGSSAPAKAHKKALPQQTYSHLTTQILPKATPFLHGSNPTFLSLLPFLCQCDSENLFLLHQIERIKSPIEAHYRTSLQQRPRRTSQHPPSQPSHTTHLLATSSFQGVLFVRTKISLLQIQYHHVLHRPQWSSRYPSGRFPSISTQVQPVLKRSEKERR